MRRRWRKWVTMPRVTEMARRLPPIDLQVEEKLTYPPDAQVASPRPSLPSGPPQKGSGRKCMPVLEYQVSVGIGA